MMRQYHLPLPQQEALTLEDFLPAASNEQAVRWLFQTDCAAWPSHTLILCGPEGCGKTHLLHAWAAQKGATHITAGDAETLAQLIDKPSVFAAFAVDDADHVAQHKAQQEWLQHFYNATKAAQIPVLLTARTPPAQWGLSLKDIETRLKSCACVSLQEPDDELTRGLLLKLFRDRQLMVEAGVVEYLAQRVERTGAAIRQLVAKLDEASLETGRKISVPFAQKVLMQHEPEAEDDHDQNA